MGGTPSQVRTRGVPLPMSGWGFPIPGQDRGYPFPGQDGGYPMPDQDGGTPLQDWMEVPPIGTGCGCPPVGTRCGYPPCRDWMWVPPLPPSRLDGVTPPPPAKDRETEQLHSGRYASCVHAGSCFGVHTTPHLDFPKCYHLILCNLSRGSCDDLTFVTFSSMTNVKSSLSRISALLTYLGPKYQM